MTKRSASNPTRPLLFMLVLCAVALGGLGEARATEPSQASFPRPTMRAVFAEIRALVPLAMREDRWGAPEERAKILASLDRLTKAASILETHGRNREAGFNAIALNLQGDLGETYDYFKAGRYDEARFFFAGSLHSCVSCHTRLSTDRTFSLADELMDDSEVKALEPRDRAWMLTVVRRFDDALTIWEDLILDREKSASELHATGLLDDYLNVAIRTRGDIARASLTLGKFAARGDLPLYLERRVAEWQRALSELDKKEFEPPVPGSLVRGVQLAMAAGRVAEGPFGRAGLVQDLAAASHLVRWLEQVHESHRASKQLRNLTDKERQDRSLAYYWLGVVEARSLDGFWVNLSTRHLEASVRADPTGSTAQKAYSLLEENHVLGYGGSSGEHLPTDVWNLLHELRELMKISE